MEAQFAVAAAALLVAMALAVARAAAGPTVFDRILAANTFGAKTVLLIAVIGFMSGRPDFLDLGLIYALINFVGAIAVLRYFRSRTFGDTVGGGIGGEKRGEAP